MKKKKVNLRDLKSTEHSDGHSPDDGHNHNHAGNTSGIKTYLPAIFSFVLLMDGYVLSGI